MFTIQDSFCSFIVLCHFEGLLFELSLLASSFSVLLLVIHTKYNHNNIVTFVCKYHSKLILGLLWSFIFTVVFIRYLIHYIKQRIFLTGFCLGFGNNNDMFIQNPMLIAEGIIITVIYIVIFFLQFYHKILETRKWTSNNLSDKILDNSEDNIVNEVQNSFINQTTPMHSFTPSLCILKCVWGSLLLIVILFSLGIHFDRGTLLVLVMGILQIPSTTNSGIYCLMVWMRLAKKRKFKLARCKIETSYKDKVSSKNAFMDQMKLWIRNKVVDLNQIKDIINEDFCKH